MPGNKFHEPQIWEFGRNPSKKILMRKNGGVVWYPDKMIGIFFLYVIEDNIMCFTHIPYNFYRCDQIGLEWWEFPNHPAVACVYIGFVECIPVRNVLPKLIN